MKKQINYNDFINEFKDYRRFENFGYDGLNELYNYLVEFELDTGTELELDVTALCCDFSLYSIDDVVEEYSIDKEVEELTADYVIAWLEYRTTVIKVDDGTVIVQDF